MKLPLLVTRALVALPTAMIPIDIARPSSLAAIQAAQAADGQLVLALEKGEGCHGVGTLVELHQVSALPGGRLRVLVRTLQAVRVTPEGDGFAIVQSLPVGPDASEVSQRALMDLMTAYVIRHPGLDDDLVELFSDASIPTVLATGLIGQLGPFSATQLQQWLASPVAERVAGMHDVLQAAVAGLPEKIEIYAPAPTDELGPMPEGVEDGMAWTARLHLRTGLLGPDEVIAVTIDAWRGAWQQEHGSIEGLAARAGSLVEAIEANESERRAAWPEATSCDHLEAALEELEAEGFVTGLMGVDLADALASVQVLGDAKPYAVFHQRDLVAAVNGRGLDLAFGGPNALDAGRRAAQALEAHGLHITWPERSDVRIRVQMPWQRRRGGVRLAA